MIHKVYGLPKEAVNKLVAYTASAYRNAGLKDFITATNSGEISACIDTESIDVFQHAAKVIIAVPATSVVKDNLESVLGSIAQTFADAYKCVAAVYCEVGDELRAFACSPDGEPTEIGVEC